MANPPPTIDSNLAIVTQTFLTAGAPSTSMCVFGLHTTNPPSSADAQAVVNGFQTHFNTRWSAAFFSGTLIEPPTIKLGDGSSTPFEAIATGAAVAGGAASSPTSPAVALLIKKTTGLGGKANRGRTYLPWVLDENNVDPYGIIAAGAHTTYQTDANNFLNDLNAANYPMCIVQKVFNQPLPPRFVTRLKLGPVVTAWTVESMVATQRRRQRP